MSISFIWERFWDVSPIRGISINNISTPLIGENSFLIPLYIFLVFATVVIFLIDIVTCYRGKPLERLPRGQKFQLRQGAASQAVMKSLMLATVAAGFLFALRMDYGWYKMWQLDKVVTASRSIDENVMLFPRSLAENTAFQRTYNFAQEFKKRMPSFETVKIVTNNSYVELFLRNYLLPFKISEDANYIIVVSTGGRGGISYELRDAVLFINGIVFERDVMFAFSYGEIFFVFKKNRDI